MEKNFYISSLKSAFEMAYWHLYTAESYLAGNGDDFQPSLAADQFIQAGVKLKNIEIEIARNFKDEISVEEIQTIIAEAKVKTRESIDKGE